MTDRDSLDVEAAWRVLRALEPISADLGTAADRPAPHHDPVLSVDADGRWTSSLSVTDDARDLLDLFVPLRLRSRWVVGQLGQSLDGRIATGTGHSHYISGPEDRFRLHRLRALADAVVVGAGTVAADDPRLTVRHVEGPNPVRVVLDPRGRLDPGHRLFGDGEAPTLWLRTTPGREPHGPEPAPVEVVAVETDAHGTMPPARVVETLAARGLRRPLVEGGGRTVSRFLEAGLLDRLHVSVAPLILGSGRPSFTLPEIETLDEALRPPVRHFRLGSDVLFDLDLGAPGA